MDKPLDGQDLIPLLTSKTPAPARDLFWSSGSEEGWWAVRSGDWKLVGEKGRNSLFDLSQDISEANNLAAQKPEKLQELTRLHDAWLAEMQAPVRGQGKRYGLEGTAHAKAKKPKSERKRNNKEEV